MEARRPGENPMQTARAEAHETVDKEKRCQQILEVMTEPMTAKEVAIELFVHGYVPTADRNYSAPRLTEMTRDGRVQPIGRKKCTYTGKSVTIYARRE